MEQLRFDFQPTVQAMTRAIMDLVIQDEDNAAIVEDRLIWKAHEIYEQNGLPEGMTPDDIHKEYLNGNNT